MPHPKGRGSADWKVSPASGRTGQVEAQRAAPLHNRDTARKEIKLKRPQKLKRKPLQKGLSGPTLLRALTRLTSWITNTAPPHVIPQKCKDGQRILSKTLNGRSFPQEKDDQRTQKIEKGLSNCLRTTTVTKPWSYTQRSSSQNNTTSAGDISTTNHQRQNVKNMI